MKHSLMKIRQFIGEHLVRSRQSMGSKAGSKAGSSEAVESFALIPSSSQEAHTRLRLVLDQRAMIGELNHDEFMRGWMALVYIAPALNPDEAATEDGGWPVTWVPLATEALRRFDLEELTKEELYPRVSCLC